MCKFKRNFEIITEKEDFYKIKTELEKKIDTFNYSAIEWRAFNYIDLNKEQSDKIIEVLTALEELDDVQNIFTNANLEKYKYENYWNRPWFEWRNSCIRK